MTTKIGGVMVEGSFARGFVVPKYIQSRMQREKLFQAALDAEDYGDRLAAERFLQKAVAWDNASHVAAAA